MLSAILAHAPALQTVVPLIAAPLCVLFGRRHLAWAITLAASLISALFAAYLLAQTLDGSVISYELGGWAPPLGIEYRIDAVNAFVLFIVASVGALVALYARESIEQEIDPALHVYFYTAFLLCLTGLLGVTITGDAFNVFVFLEISSLSTYTLVALGAGRDQRALTAAYNYLIMGTIGATFFVIGIGFLYMLTGTLNMADLAERIAALGDNRTLRIAFVFIFVGIGLKLAMFPLHLWLPNAYSYAPSVVSVFLAATATKVAVYVMLRFLFTVFGFDYGFQAATLQTIVVPLAVIAMFASSIVAIFQSDLKRMLAYSSVAQIGYILLGISLLNKPGLTAGIIHLFNHAVIKGALFMAVGAFVYRIGSSRIEDLRGIGKQMPWMAAAFVAAGLGLIGVPLTAGFISKWYLIQATLDEGAWWLALLIVGSSLLAVIYVWRVVEAMYLAAPVQDAPVKKAPWSMIVPTWIMVLASLYFGINTELTGQAASTAADLLIQATQIEKAPETVPGAPAAGE